MIYESKIPLTAPPPEDLTIPQFILDTHHFARPKRPNGHPWLIDDITGKAYGLEDCRTRTHGLANELYLRYALQEEDVVVIFSPNDIDYAIAIWASHRLGAICSGANPGYTTAELVVQLQITKASLLVTHPESLEVALQAAREVNLPTDRIVLFGQASPETKFATVEGLINAGLRTPMAYTERKLRKGEGRTKLAFLCFSSGTTGRPKAVAIPHASVTSNVLQLSVFNKVNEDYAPLAKRKFTPGDVCLGVVPMYHIYGLVLNLQWLIFCGITVVVVRKFDFEGMLRSIERHRITLLMLVPPHIVLLVKHPATNKYDLSSLRYVMCGAAPLSTELMQQFWKKYPNVRMGQAYGMTETGPVTVMCPVDDDNAVAGSAGQLVSGAIAKIVKADGTLAGPYEPGEFVVKGPQNSFGYFKNQEATDETYSDGWVRSGDEVIVDKDGNFFVTDRIKEIFKVRGYQVAPAELEGHILEHPDVADCAVVPRSDSYSGEVPMAYVTLHADVIKRVKADAGEEERIKESIKKHVSDNKVRYKWLDGGVQFIETIPKNPSGKLLRRVLRDQARQLQMTKFETRAKL